MRIVFSKDRPAQLDLLLRSLDRNTPGERTAVIYRDGPHGSAARVGYAQLVRERVGSGTWWFREREAPDLGFDGLFRMLLGETEDEMVTLFCDDDVMYRPVPSTGAELLASDQRVLTVSLRLGAGNRQMRAPRMTVAGGLVTWRWTNLAAHDFGYPASVDGHTFRVRDVVAMIGGDRIPNPTMLETVMALRARRGFRFRPLMACYPDQPLCGVDVNRVSDQSGVTRRATVYPQPVRELNDRFVRGDRIDLDGMDFSGVDGAHVELPYVWRGPS